MSYLFDRKGLLVIPREDGRPDEDTVLMQALEAGAEDVIVNEDSFEVLTEPSDFDKVKTALEEAGHTFTTAEIRWLPQTTVRVEGENAEKLAQMLDAFDDNDDVQDVYHNFELPE